MIVWELKLFGRLPLLALSRTRYELVEEDESPAVGGGSTHDFERDLDPLSPTADYEWEWEEDKGGFGFR